ncbi:MAG: hypothetical protein HQK54_11350 [Oligoflexales bacterium]|nr:hypothetical protein [Oligoflexales bacterium]
MTNNMLKNIFFVLVISGCLSKAQVAFAAGQEESYESGQKKQTKKGKAPKKNEKAAAQPLQQKTEPHFDLGIGFGLFSFYLPQPTIEASYLYNRLFEIGIEAGYMSLPIKQFSGTSSYQGIDLKYFPLKSSFFLGMSYGTRDLTIITDDETSVTIDNAGEVSHFNSIVRWTRKTSQTLTSPKVGWHKIWDSGSSFVFSFGAIIPKENKFEISSSPSKIEGVTDEDYESEKQKKSDDVRKIAGSVSPLIELKYIWLFHAF